MISVVVNTAALGEKAKAVVSSGGVVHGLRADLLRQRILPQLQLHADETIVVGEWEPSRLAKYVACPSVAFDCTDALQQRQEGFRVAHGDIIVFLHDDHLPNPNFFDVIRERYAKDPSWDVLVPSRFCSPAPHCAVALNNGKEGGYVMGHCAVMRRRACDAVPWSSVKKVFTWDVDHTRRLRKAGMTIRFVDDLAVCDLETELGAEPWR